MSKLVRFHFIRLILQILAAEKLMHSSHLFLSPIHIIDLMLISLLYDKINVVI